jgi:hypothetical protein
VDDETLKRLLQASVTARRGPARLRSSHLDADADNGTDTGSAGQV